MKTIENKIEEDKKIIGEYVKIFPEATKLRKSKKFKSALEKYLQCYSLIESTDLIDKQCETTFYLGHCYLKLNKVSEGYTHLSRSNELVDEVVNSAFSYDKVKGKLSAQMILMQFALATTEEAISFAKKVVSHMDSLVGLIEKMNIFYYFIKELLSFLKSNRKVIAFLNEYESAKNEIIFNNESTLSSSLKASFYAIMTVSTKISLLQRNDAIHYSMKYNLDSNHPLIAFMDKNSDLIRDSNSQRAKSALDSFMKTNKIKLGVTSLDLIQEQRMRIENFNELFNILSGSFGIIFRKYFSLVAKLDTEIAMTTESPRKNYTPNTKNLTCEKVVFHVQSSNNKDEPQLGMKPGSASNKNLFRRKPQLGIEGLNSLNKNKEAQPNANSISPSKNMFNKRNTVFAMSNESHGKGIESKNIAVLSLHDIPCDTETTKTSMSDTNSNFIQFITEKEKDKENFVFEENNINKEKTVKQKEKKDMKDLKSEKNDYDHSRIENISTANDPSFNIKRKRNIVLFQTIVDELSKGKTIRDCDIISTKIQSYVKNYSMHSLKGNHHTYGESLSVNQDICFCYENFLLLRNLHFFGVCDGHGEFGHLVSDHIKVYLAANIQYIELDNYLIRKNKNINNLITSLYSVSEKSNVKDMNIIKYFYDKFSINCSDMSLYKKTFSEINCVLKESFRQTHEDLLKRDFDSSSSGSTACTLLMNDKRIFLSNVGDSKAILCSCIGNYEWKVSQLTKDHKPEDKEERDRIIKSKGKIKRLFNEEDAKEIGPYRVWFVDETKGPGLAMSRSIGDNASKAIGVLAEPDTYEYSLNQYDKFIVIASDGVWEYITCEEALDIVKKVYEDFTKTAVDACDILTTIATQRWQKV